ncbi:dihydroorotate dehydrogenase (quinone), partial [Rhizobiaceae sp. 2RAB30]
MIGPFEWIGRQALFAFDPETAHGLSIAALKSGLPLCGRATSSERLRTTVSGLDFPNPLGMAAGYDKNAEVPDALLGLGFGFAEVGTLTPLPQQGNP